MILHLELLEFFVSVERNLSPILRDHALVVGGHPKSRGVVSACSRDLQKRGVRIGMALSSAYSMAPDAAFVEPHFLAYTQISEKIKASLCHQDIKMTQVSVDEFYLDLAKKDLNFGDWILFGHTLQAQILKDFGISATVGLGSSSDVAKLASALANPRHILAVLPGEEETFSYGVQTTMRPYYAPERFSVLDALVA